MEGTVRIRFPKAGVEAEVDAGDSLVDAAYRHDLPLRFKCERAVCTTCLTEVLSGAENLTPAGERERATLERAGAAPNWRLSCQCRVVGDVELDYIPPGDERRKGASEARGGLGG